MPASSAIPTASSCCSGRCAAASSAAAFEAPDKAVLLVQSVTRDAAGVMHGLHQFFDADGRLLDSVAKPDYRFDPRTRPWYKAVGDGDAAIMTAALSVLHDPGDRRDHGAPDGRRQSGGRPRRHHGNDRGRAEGPQDHAVDGARGHRFRPAGHRLSRCRPDDRAARPTAGCGWRGSTSSARRCWRRPLRRWTAARSAAS